MDEEVKNICQLLKEESEAVSSYTERISEISGREGMEAVVQTLEMIRLDEVEHIQNLTIELTKLMSSGTVPAAAAGGGTDEQ